MILLAGPRARRAFSVAVAAVVFGVVLSVVKGNDYGVRQAVGNVSAPWLLLPFAAGAWVGGRRVATGAAVGLVACMVALVGFYLANVWVLDLGPHSLLTDVQLTFNAGRRYLLLGLVAGPVMGVLGASWRQTRSRGLALTAASTLLLEPFAWLAYGAGGVGGYPHQVTVWAAEMVLGAALCAVVLRSYLAQRYRRS